MATITSSTFPRMLKILRENNNVKEKREVLTYISSQAKKLESSGAVKEDRYKDLCRLVIEAFTKHEGSMQNEALGALNAIVKEFKAYPLHLFESMLQTDKRTRVKILKLLEVVEDNAISAAANDGQTLNFFKDCMRNVQPNLMEWLTPTACVDNLQMLTKVENQSLSDEQKLDEDTNSYALILLRRLYRLAAITFDQNVQRFDTLLMEKIIVLAYMGHKRQRGPALKVLQQAVATNSSSRIRKDYPNLWVQYKTNLQSTYCKRMLLLVTTCDPDWTIQWNTTIQFLSTDLHRGASLINNLLSVEEKAFKSTDPIIRRQAFLSWRLLIDNFALDHQELATARRIKLLCIPLNTKNSKTELIALTKLEVWWHLIIKLYKDVAKFASPVITQFLNYCFGPLGDTPLLSSKFDIVASPGKRFLKTKVVAVDALCQLVVTKEDLFAVCAPMLEERLPHAISDEVFQECSKSIIHSVGEALLILGQLTDQEMKNRFQLGKTLWTNLMIYIKNIKLESKDHLYKDVILVVTELGNHIDKVMVKNMIFNVILPDVKHIIEKAEFHDNALPELVLKLLSPPILDKVLKYILDHNSDTIKCLLERCFSPEFTYSSGVLGFLETIIENLKTIIDAHKNMTAYIELWSIIAQILTRYITTCETANETEHNFQTVKLVLSLPFQYTYLENLEQIQNQAKVWKALYKEFELQSDLTSAVKPNEILLNTANMMREYLNINKNCCSFIVNCLDALLSTLDYDSLLAQDEIPSILQLILDVIIISFNNPQNLNSEITLKMLSAMLITVYGHSPQKVISYLHSCKSVIKSILASQIKTLYKEVANMWEYIVSIFKGLNKQVNHELLSSFKEIIIIAMNHPNPDLKSLTQSIFEVKDCLDSTAKCILEEIEKTIEKSHSKSDSVTKRKSETEQTKDIRMAGSFLNRKSVTTKSVSSKPSEKNDKNTLILPEPDSQDYVYIKTDLKLDVNRLTEHQKESLKKKREDIPALYNDLSQSSSQNSQNLQEWFDIKVKHINETDKINNRKSDSVTQKLIDNDANKENKIMQTKSNVVDKVVDTHSELDVNIEENIADTKQNEDSTKEVEKIDSNKKQEEIVDISKQTNSATRTESFSGWRRNISPEMEDIDATTISVTKKLNFESRENSPEDKIKQVRQASPSMLDSIKRRRNSMTKLNSSLKSDEAVESQKDSNVQRTLRIKVHEKSGTNIKQKSDDDTDIKENSYEKKGIKRKYMSDTESDVIIRRKRKSFHGDNGETSRGSDNPDLIMDNVSQRVRNEMSRLKINMVFESPVVNRRRNKHSDEEKETLMQEIDAGKKHRLRKYGTSDNKSYKLKSLDTKFIGSRRFSKTQEKNTKDADGTDQIVIKRRGRRSTKHESNKNDLDINKDVKKSSDTIDKVPELKNSDTDMTDIVSTSSQAIQDVTINRVQDEKPEADNSKLTNLNVESLEVTKPSKQSQDEVEDFVESSQMPNVDIKLDKKCGEKQCFIKINKIENVYSKASDVTMEKNYVPESIPMDSDDNVVPDPCEQSDEANPYNNTEMNDERNKDKDSTSKDLLQEINSSDIIKVIIPENQKTIDNSSSVKSIRRAAHMLGLVTKQAQRESDSSAIAEDEASIKKLKTKDAENDTNKKTSATKDIDKIGGPSGSRQEKIFSNMKSADYCLSPSIHAFTTLKNDGEKLSFKLDKNISDCLSMENSVDKESEGNASSLYEKDDLPILEWSSANPPSLTASPSASILKRQRSNVSELELDSSTTPNKRKRVSFADPPVSKEMGYEISNTEFPQKLNKYSTARSPIPRKDSPLKLKQTKLKFIPTDAEKIIIENDESDTEASEVEKKNESLIKISEEYSEAMTTHKSISDNLPENDNNKANTHARIKINEELGIAQEIEITSDSFVPENQQALSSEDSEQNPVDVTSIDCIVMEVSETQQDLFDGMDTTNNIPPVKINNDDINISIQNNSADSVKLNVINDSVIAALSTKDDNTTTNMEDTVDIQNMTELNSTVNTDEVFCGKLIRTSTETTENMEQDTLPATDSIFASLPLTQESTQESTQEFTTNQEAQNNMELDPELLDSTLSIYPTLSSCVEPINTIIEQLTYPLWRKNLSSYLTNRSLYTIGDLAQLSEREINRIPMKGNPKTEFVKKVLKHFESTCMLQAKSSIEPNVKIQSPIIPMDETQTIVSTIVLPLSVVGAESAVRTVDNKSLSCNAPLNRSTENVSDNLSREKSLAECLDKTESVTSDMEESIYSQNPDLSVLENEETSTKEPITVESLSETTDNIKSVPIASSSESIIANEVVSSSSANMNTSESHAKSSNVYDELLITHSSVGTSTDEIGSATPSVQKVTRSVESQMALEELLDEIDVNLVLESAVRRCSPEAILLQYKVKMGHLKDTELVRETIRMLGLQNIQQINDASLKAACRACGVNKVLLRLPDIFSYDKQFFNKVLNVYSKKLNIVDCLNVFNYNKLKNAICQKCTSSELGEMLSEKLKREDQEGIKQPMTELSSLDAMLKRLPRDVIISHTVANEELIPAPLVLDIALQNNSSGDIAQALKQSPVLAKRVLDKLWTHQYTIAHIENGDVSKENLLNIFKSVCSKLSAQELLNAYHETMTNKLAIKNENE
ncbi:uncharacterized protein [Anoplolepis gracilipes]|uniref:uncharacterized protein isoform X2 n=1 Tax=Anoplolepis gracilipes TaxID=354296 RepID=UPI003BA318EC